MKEKLENNLDTWIAKATSLYGKLFRRKNSVLSGRTDPVIEAFVRDQIEKPATFNSTISKNDDMYLFALQHFKGNRDRACIELLTTGKQSMDVIRQIIRWNFKGFKDVSGFLDFASGHGRLTRFLTQELSPTRISVCDISEDAIKFQKKQFGVNGIVSVQDPQDFNPGNQYDCIFVASLFSHLPEKYFTGWLRRLYELLTRNGVLVFSVHDAAVLPSHLKMEGKDILFLPESESRSLDKEEYGTTYVTESFISRIIAQITGGSRYYRKKRGLWWFQDLYMLSKNPDKNFGDLDIFQGPAGYVDRCVITDKNEVCVDGWAADFGTDTHIKEIRISVKGKIIHRCIPTYDRPDISRAFHDKRGLKSGFSCCFPGDAADRSDILIIKAINSLTMEHILRIGTLESMADAAFTHL